MEGSEYFVLFFIADCPLDLSGSNFTLAASICSNDEDRGTCCRYLNALIAVSIARYGNLTGDLGVSSDLSQICLGSISETLELYGVTTNATAFCGFGTKIPVNYECQGRTTVTQMLESPKFANVTANCKLPLSAETDCRTCLNAGILYLRNLIGAVDNMTLSTCRDATFVALASQVDNGSAVDIASCFFGVQELMTPSGTTRCLKIVGLNRFMSCAKLSYCIGFSFMYACFMSLSMLFWTPILDISVQNK